MGIAEDIRADLRDAVRDVKARDLLVRLENIVSQHRQLAALADRHLRQILAEIECVAIDLRHRVRDRDLRQAAVTKGTPADPLQLRAFFKGHALQIAAPVEIEFADVGDIFADHKPLDLSVVLTDRSHATEFIVIHSSAATDDHRSVAVENIDRRLPAQARIDHIRSRTADKLPVFKFTRQAAHLIDALIGKTVAVDRIHFIGQCDRTGNGNAANKVTVSARLQILCPAGIQALLCADAITAGLASEHIRVAVIHICVLVIFADGHVAFGILIKHADTAVGRHIVSSDRRLITVGANVHIDTAEINRCSFKMEFGVVDDRIRFSAGRTADIVNRSVRIHLTVDHGSGARITMIVASEVEVDAGSITRSRQVLDIRLSAAGGVGVVGGNVRHQYLPGAGALRRILNQPIGKALEAVLVGGVVQNGDIHVAALHGVPVGGDAEGALDRDGTVAAVVRLVVADNVEHIRVADAVERKQLQRVVPLVIVADVIHCVAQLDAEVILTGQLVRDAVHALESGFLLNVGQKEEAGLLLRGGHRETADIRPDGTVADAVIVRRSGGQAREGDTVHAADLVAGGVGDQAARALDPRRAAQVGVRGELGHSLLSAGGRIAHPSDGFSVCIRGKVIDDIIGGTALITHGIIGIQRDLIRAVALLVGCAQIHASLTRGQGGNIESSAAVSHAQKHIISIHTDAGRSLTVLNDGNGRGSRTADDRSIRSDAVDSLNWVIFHRRREAGGILVHFADAHSLRLLAAVGTLRDANVDAAALDHGGGNVHRDRGQSTGSIHIVVDPGDAHRDHTLGRIIIISTVDAVGESHRGRILTGQRNVGAQGCDRCRIAAVELHHPRLAHHG